MVGELGVFAHSLQEFRHVILMLLSQSSNLLSSKSNHSNTSFLFGTYELFKEVFEDWGILFLDPMHGWRLGREIGKNRRWAGGRGNGVF
jgi:hypothetical protein